MAKYICTLTCLIASLTFGQTLEEQYEKAYFLETAKGQREEALKIYGEITTLKATDSNREIIIKALERMLVLHKKDHTISFQQKVDNFDLNPSIKDHVMDTFGEPTRYAANNQEYSPNELPHTGYSMYYPEGFIIQTSFNRIQNIQFKQPIYTIEGITIGATEEELLKKFPPTKYEDYYARSSSYFEDGVIYTNISKSLDFKTYHTTNGIIFYLNKGSLTGITLNNPLPKSVQ